MAQQVRRAIEWPRMLGGVALCVLGVVCFYYVSDGKVGPALFLFGLVLCGIACLGRGCNLCGKVLRYREFGFEPARADEVRDAVDSEDVDRVIALLAGPRIGDLTDPRTALMISCCPKCQQLAELVVGQYGGGFRTLSERVYQGPEVARLWRAVRSTRKRR